MGSSTHTQGAPQRPGLASRRTLAAVLERNRERTADNRLAIYVRPLGRNMHLVRNHCNAQEYRVGSLIAGLTFSPGSEVLLMSNSGHPGEVIAGGPPVGRRGASVAPFSLRVAPFEVTSSDPCDLSYHLGHEYTAIYANFSTGAISAWLYTDGDYASDIASTTIADLTFSTDHYGYIYGDALLSDHSLVFFRTQHQQKAISWDLDLNTVYSVNLPNSLTDITDGWAYAGGWIYYVRHSTTQWKLRKVRADMTDDQAVSTLSRTAGGSASPLVILSASQMNILDKIAGNVRIISMPLDGSAGDQGDSRTWSGRATDGLRLAGGASYDVGSRGRQLFKWNPGLRMTDVGDSGDEVLHYPDGWTGGPSLTQDSAAPNPDRTAWIAYEAGTGIFRWPLTPDPDGHCPAPIIAVEQHAGNDPTVMFPRN